MLKKYIPQPFIHLYHYLFAVLGAKAYGNPSRQLFVVGITGTKGKSTTSELVRTMLAGAGYKVALASTIHFRIGDDIDPNLFKMTMPGRAYLQKFMKKAVAAGCTHFVLEMTSEGAKQFRHKGIELDALVFTNLQPEHLESHGSLEAYAEAKLSLAREMERSSKRPRYIVANTDDNYGNRFLDHPVEKKVPYSLSLAEPYNVDDRTVRFVYKNGELFTVPLPGLFNLRNILATVALGEAIGVPIQTIKKALEYVQPIAGRAERVEAGQHFTVVIDYAHTPDSLKALFETYKAKRMIVVMGSTGGGRDQWKRPEMGKIADYYCSLIYLTNEDPYDEDPEKIVADIAEGITSHTPRIVLNRRGAIAQALSEAKAGDVVLITGKGTDPYIMGPQGSKQTWSDKKVAEEELDKLLHKQTKTSH